MREVEEWVGKTDDANIPKRVKLRIWEREGGVCSITGRKIRPGDAFDYEHRIALCNGGEHRESNIVLALREPHRAKTKADLKTKAKIARVRSRHLGIAKSRSPLPGGKGSPWKRKIGGPAVRRDDE